MYNIRQLITVMPQSVVSSNNLTMKGKLDNYYIENEYYIENFTIGSYIKRQNLRSE